MNTLCVCTNCGPTFASGHPCSTASMCGRYVFTSPLEAIQQMFRFDQLLNLGPNYNVAPTHDMPIVRRKKGDRRNELVMARWGLIPHWAKDKKIAYSTINADRKRRRPSRRFGCLQTPTVPGAGGCVHRMAPRRQREMAASDPAEGRRAVCLCRIVVDVALAGGRGHRELHNHDDRTE